MPGLGETLRGLARRRAEPSGERGRLDETTAFGRNPGALRMLSYAPEGLAVGAPLVVLLHGCTQDAEGYAAAAGWLSLADHLGFAVLAPQQTAANNPNRCFNWYERADTTRGQGEAASIDAMILHTLAERQLDSQRVFVTGLSAGGAMAAVMLATYPERFAGGAIVAGLPYGVAHTLQEAVAAMRGSVGLSAEELARRVTCAAPRPGRPPRVSIWHGDADHTVDASAADALARQWSGVHGLTAAPDKVETYSGRTRAVWFSPAGEAIVEQHMIAGLGHGTPLSTSGDEAYGFVAPYMLEAEVSSALLTARFWGLAPEVPQIAATASPTSKREPGLNDSLGASVLAATSPYTTKGVRQIIENALRTAGLMRRRG